VSAVASGFLAPLFFASIGLHLDISALWTIPVFVILLIVVALATKLLGAGLAARAVGLERKEAAGIGIAMSARGAVELIIAGIALEAGLFSRPEPVPPIVENLFSAVVIMAIATTLFMPVGLRFVLSEKSCL
jgi:Kef-type K+ transport system membrane component KefB